MIAGMIAATVVVRFLLPTAGAPEPCNMLSAAEIAAALGSAPSAGKPDGPDLDKESGAKVWTCTRGVGSALLIISLAELPTPAAADRALDTLAVMANESAGDEFVPTFKEEPGLGGRALAGTSSYVAIWAVVKGRHMLSLSLSGEGLDGPRYKEPLKRLTARALSKI